MTPWPGEQRRAEDLPEPQASDDGRVPGVRRHRLGPAQHRGDATVQGGRLGGPAPRGDQCGLPRRPSRRAGRWPQGAQQRHRLRLPSAQRLRPPHRPRQRPRARRRARARAATWRRRRRRAPAAPVPRGHALLPPARRPRHRGVLRRLALRRVLGRRPPDARGRRVRARAHGPPHRRVRRCRRQGRRLPAGARRARRRPRRRSRRRPGSPGRRRRRGHAAGRHARRAPARGRRRALGQAVAPAHGQGRLGDRADALGGRGHPPGLRRRHRRPARGRRVAGAESGGSRASSACTRATTATASATTRSARVATTPTRCTGSRTPATSRTATCSCSTPGSRSTRSSPPTSPAPSR